MAVYKRGGVWWYGFLFNGERIQESTKQGNKRVAETMMAAHRTSLAKGEVGLRDKTPVPKFKDFAPRFEEAIQSLCQDKPDTVKFYKERLRRLLDYRPLVSCRLDLIDEQLIEGLKQQRLAQISRLKKRLSVAAINRELATLRRALRLAQEWRIIDRVPKIRLLKGEFNREFVLSYAQEELYLRGAPQDLKDVALLIVEEGTRPGEAAALTWPNVHLKAAHGARFGYIHIPAGGKSKFAKRNLTLTAKAAEMLEARKEAVNGGAFVFPGRSEEYPVLVSSLDHQHSSVRAQLKLPDEFVLHSLRHTMLTRLGESGADAFKIMKIAGHSSITVSQRYVHPSPESLETSFERLDAMNESRRKKVIESIEAREGLATFSTTVEEQQSSRKSAKPLCLKKKGA